MVTRLRAAVGYGRRMSELESRSVHRALRVVAYWVVGGYIAMWVVARNESFLFLLLLAWLAAVAMDPPIRKLTDRGMRRGAATGAVMLSVTVVLVGFLALFGGVLLSQATGLIQAVPSIVTHFVEWADRTFGLTLNAKSLTDSLNVTPTQIAKWASSFAGGLVGVVSLLVGGIFQLFTMLLFAFYIAAEGPEMRRVIGSWLSPRAQLVFVRTWDIAVEKTGGFVVSRLVLAAISSVAHSTAYAVIGVPYWLAMGIITGTTSQFIPTVGTYLGALVPMAVAFYVDPMNLLWIALFATGYQQVENYFLAPRISKRTMNIHPAIAFGSVLLFTNLFGAIGALISIPLAAAIVAVVDTYGKRYELIDELSLS